MQNDYPLIKCIDVIEHKTLFVLGPDFYSSRRKYLLDNVNTNKKDTEVNYL